MYVKILELQQIIFSLCPSTKQEQFSTFDFPRKDYFSYLQTSVNKIRNITLKQAKIDEKTKATSYNASKPNNKSFKKRTNCLCVFKKFD